mgnify:FL=1
MRHYTGDEKKAAIELYFDTEMTSQEVVDKLGYPTGQCLESWLRKDERYSDGNFCHGFYPVSLRREAVRLRLREGVCSQRHRPKTGCEEQGLCAAVGDEIRTGGRHGPDPQTHIGVSATARCPEHFR